MKPKLDLNKLRMPADEFERAMRRAIRTPLDEATRKAKPPRRKAKRKQVAK